MEWFFAQNTINGDRRCSTRAMRKELKLDDTLGNYFLWDRWFVVSYCTPLYCIEVYRGRLIIGGWVGKVGCGYVTHPPLFIMHIYMRECHEVRYPWVSCVCICTVYLSPTNL